MAALPRGRRTLLPRPAHGHSKDGHNKLKQVLLSLRVSGDGGPRSVWVFGTATRVIVSRRRGRLQNVSLGARGHPRHCGTIVRHIVDGPLDCVWKKGIGSVTLVPRTCAVRQELEAWGQQQTALPLLARETSRTRREKPRTTAWAKCKNCSRDDATSGGVLGCGDFARVSCEALGLDHA